MSNTNPCIVAHTATQSFFKNLELISRTTDQYIQSQRQSQKIQFPNTTQLLHGIGLLVESKQLLESIQPQNNFTSLHERWSTLIEAIGVANISISAVLQQHLQETLSYISLENQKEIIEAIQAKSSVAQWPAWGRTMFMSDKNDLIEQLENYLSTHSVESVRKVLELCKTYEHHSEDMSYEDFIVQLNLITMPSKAPITTVSHSSTTLADDAIQALDVSDIRDDMTTPIQLFQPHTSLEKSPDSNPVTDIDSPMQQVHICKNHA